MAEVTAGMIKELRERTAAGMSDCKKALVECAGDMDKAIDIIRVRVKGAGGLLGSKAKAS